MIDREEPIKVAKDGDDIPRRPVTSRVGPEQPQVMRRCWPRRNARLAVERLRIDYSQPDDWDCGTISGCDTIVLPITSSMRG